MTMKNERFRGDCHRVLYVDGKHHPTGISIELVFCFAANVWTHIKEVFHRRVWRPWKTRLWHSPGIWSASVTRIAMSALDLADVDVKDEL